MSQKTRRSTTLAPGSPRMGPTGPTRTGVHRSDRYLRRDGPDAEEDQDARGSIDGSHQANAASSMLDSAAGVAFSAAPATSERRRCRTAR